MRTTVDLRGVACPINFVKAKLALEALAEGATVEFLLDDGEAVKNVPKSLKGEGERLVGLKRAEEGHYVLTVEKAR